MKVLFSPPYSSHKSIYIYGTEKTTLPNTVLRFGCGVGYAIDNKINFRLSIGFQKDCVGTRRAFRSYNFTLPFRGPWWLHKIIDNRVYNRVIVK